MSKPEVEPKDQRTGLTSAVRCTVTEQSEEQSRYSVPFENGNILTLHDPEVKSETEVNIDQGHSEAEATDLDSPRELHFVKYVKQGKMF